MRTSTKDVRRHRRVPYSGPIDLSWDDPPGNTRHSRGKCLDLSPAGLLIEALEPIPVRTCLMVRAERIKVTGSSWVKHVARHGAKYRLGLELSQPLREQVIAAADASSSPAAS